MDDELEIMLRRHYRRAANDVHATPELVERLAAAGRAEAGGEPERRARRWVFPVLAAAVTAAVVLTVAVLLWPKAEHPRPLGPQPVPQTTETPSAPPMPVPSKLPKGPGASPPAIPPPSSQGSPYATPSKPVPSAPPSGIGPSPHPTTPGPHKKRPPSPSSFPSTRP